MRSTCAGNPGRNAGILEIRAGHPVRDVHEPHQIDRAVHAIEIVLTEIELGEQKIGDVLRAVFRDLQPHLVAELAVRQLAAQRGAQVLHLLLVDEELAVARHAELVGVGNLHAGEQLADVRVQDGGEEHEIVLGAGDVLGQPDHARQHPRRLHDGDARVAAECVLAFELDREIQALVEHARKGMGGIEPDRRQHRHHLAEEVGLDPFGLGRGEIGAPQEADALVGQPRQDFLVQQLVLRVDQLVGFRGHLAEHLVGPHALRADRRRAGLDLGLESRDADFEELVEIAADDAQETQPLEQRRRAVCRLRQHAPVERELAQLAVEIELR